MALAAGLALSFVVDRAVRRDARLRGRTRPGACSAPLAAILLIAIGGVLLMPRLQMQLAAAGGPVGNWAQAQAGGFRASGLGGQFLVGLLLGAVWSPCVGPTLGAASVLAARAENLALVALTMLAFGIGAALPLLAIGMMSREAVARWRSRLLSAGSGGKALMGALLVAVGVLILTGLDKRLETLLVDVSPDWLTALTTMI